MRLVLVEMGDQVGDIAGVSGDHLVLDAADLDGAGEDVRQRQEQQRHVALDETRAHRARACGALGQQVGVGERDTLGRPVVPEV